MTAPREPVTKCAGCPCALTKDGPRPYCLEEPCIAWSGRVCGHEVLFGRGACLFDDPERAAARVERLKRKAMRGKK